MGPRRMRGLLLLLAVTVITAADAADSLPAWTRPRTGACLQQAQMRAGSELEQIP